MTNDSHEVYDKAAVENIPFGRLALSMNNVSSVWNNDRAKTLYDIMHEIIESVREEIIGSWILRLVVVTSDYVTEVNKWRQELNEAWIAPSEGAIGQTLVWGNGHPKTTWAVIVLSEQVAEALLKVDIVAFGKQVFIHELAHVHDDLYYLQYIGSLPTSAGDWANLRQFIARSVWAEYFSESFAYLQVKDDFNFDENVSYTIPLLQKARMEIEREVLALQTHRDTSKVWAVAVDHLSAAFNQLGRSLGLLVAHQQVNGDSGQLEDFFEKTDGVSQAWGQIARKLLDEFVNARPLSGLEGFNVIGELIDDGFRAFGLEPIG